MRARTASAVLLIGVSALGFAACGSEGDAAGTVDEPITVGTAEVAVGGGSAAAGDTAAAADTAAASGEAAEGDAAAGKAVFASAGCGGCHTLADAGAAGAVGPNLDDLKPDAALVVATVTNGKGAMPALGASMKPEDIQNVAAYVSSVAGQ